MSKNLVGNISGDGSYVTTDPHTTTSSSSVLKPAPTHYYAAPPAQVSILDIEILKKTKVCCAYCTGRMPLLPVVWLSELINNTTFFFCCEEHKEAFKLIPLPQLAAKIITR